MWRCPQCKEPIEDQFTGCWNCGFERDNEVEVLEPAEVEAVREKETARLSGLTCDRCEVPLVDRGTVPLRTEGGQGIFVQWSVHSEKLWELGVRVCPRCRRVELYEPVEDADG